MALSDFWDDLLGRPKVHPFPRPAPQPRLLPAPPPNAIVMPSTWDEAEIAEQLRHLKARSPAMSAYFFARLRDRFLLRQDGRTAEARAVFLRKKIEEFKLSHDLQSVLNDLSALAGEREVRVRKLHLDRLDLDSKIENQSQLGQLRLDRDRLQVQYEIAVLKRKIREEERQPPPVETKLTPSQQAALKKAEVQKQIDQLRIEQAEVLGRTRDKEEQMRLSNLYGAKLEQLFDQLGKLL